MGGIPAKDGEGTFGPENIILKFPVGQIGGGIQLDTPEAGSRFRLVAYPLEGILFPDHMSAITPDLVTVSVLPDGIVLDRPHVLRRRW